MIPLTPEQWVEKLSYESLRDGSARFAGQEAATVLLLPSDILEIRAEAFRMAAGIASHAVHVAYSEQSVSDDYVLNAILACAVEKALESKAGEMEDNHPLPIA